MTRRLGHREQHREVPARRLAWADLDLGELRGLIERARLEDLCGRGLVVRPPAGGDITTAALLSALGGRAGRPGAARVMARTPVTVAGQGLVPEILRAFGEGATYQPAVPDGAAVPPGGALGRVEGPIGLLLSAERTLLNFLHHLTAVATETASWVEELSGSETRLLDTRKTTPGFRLLEKYAVACGGGWNHRLGLFDRVMFKDNHLALLGHGPDTSLEAAVAGIQENFPELLVEVEVDRLDQLDAVLAAGPDIVLFDNFTTADLREAVARTGSRAWTEASGGIRRERLAELKDLGLTFISAGAIVHQARWPDLGLDWEV